MVFVIDFLRIVLVSGSTVMTDHIGEQAVEFVSAVGIIYIATVLLSVPMLAFCGLDVLIGFPRGGGLRQWIIAIILRPRLSRYRYVETCICT